MISSGLVYSLPLSDDKIFLICDFDLFLLSRFRKYFEDFSPCSYQLILKRNIIPSDMKLYNDSSSSLDLLYSRSNSSLQSEFS